jgi:hypothetical protein
MLGEGPPSLRGLTLYIGLTGIPLGIKRVEFQFQSVLGRFAGVDGAANRFDCVSRHGGHCSQRICQCYAVPEKPWTADQRTVVRSIWYP